MSSSRKLLSLSLLNKALCCLILKFDFVAHPSWRVRCKFEIIASSYQHNIEIIWITDELISTYWANPNPVEYYPQYVVIIWETKQCVFDVGWCEICLGGEDKKMWQIKQSSLIDFSSSSWKVLEMPSFLTAGNNRWWFIALLILAFSPIALQYKELNTVLDSSSSTFLSSKGERGKKTSKVILVTHAREALLLHPADFMLDRIWSLAARWLSYPTWFVLLRELIKHGDGFN